MRFILPLYSFIITMLSPLIFIAGYAVARKKGDSARFGERFGFIKLRLAPRSKSVWFHAASVGEVRSLKNIINTIRRECPEVCMIVSTMTTAGRDAALEYLQADEAFLLPIENSAAIRYLIKLMGVKIFFIVDTELWPATVTAASKEVPIIMINGRISERTYISYMRFRFIFRYILNRFTKIFAKSQEDKIRLENIAGKPGTAQALGNIKFQTRKNPRDVKPPQGFENSKIFLAASTHAPEEEFILKNMKDYRKLFDKIVIVPRHIKRSGEIKELAEKYGFSCALYSSGNIEGKKIVVADAFGILESLYIVSDKIFVGGSISGTGGHNIYEALQFYKSVSCGPNYQNFKEICEDAASFGLLTVVRSAEDFHKWIETPEKAERKDFEDFFKACDEKNSRITQTIAAEALNRLG